LRLVLLPHQRLESALEFHVGEDDRDVVVLQLGIEDHVDSGGIGERLVDLLDGLGLREGQADRAVARRLQDRRLRAGAADLSLQCLEAGLPRPLRDHLGGLFARLAQLHLGVLVRRVEQDGLVELHHGELRAPGGAVHLALLEVELRRLDLRPGERDLVGVVARLELEGARILEHGDVPVLDRLLLARFPEGARAGTAHEERQRCDDRNTQVNSFSHRDTDLSSFGVRSPLATLGVRSPLATCFARWQDHCPRSGDLRLVKT
jgi:hypothetical protein